MMWGAKVKTPVDMPDDILRDAIDVTTKELSKCENFDNNGKKKKFLFGSSTVLVLCIMIIDSPSTARHK